MHPMSSPRRETRGGALARARMWTALVLQRLRTSVHALLVLRALGAAAVVVVLSWVGGRSPAGAETLAHGRAPVADPTDATTLPDAAPSTATATADGHTPSDVPRAPPPASSGDAGACVCEGANAARASARASPNDPVDVNAADEQELRRLPGVGQRRAEAIVALRRKLGRFRKLEELLRVKGVGRATLRRWRPLVRLEGSPQRPPADAGAP